MMINRNRFKIVKSKKIIIYLFLLVVTLLWLTTQIYLISTQNVYISSYANLKSPSDSSTAININPKEDIHPIHIFHKHNVELHNSFKKTDLKIDDAPIVDDGLKPDVAESHDTPPLVAVTDNSNSNVIMKSIPREDATSSAALAVLHYSDIISQLDQSTNINQNLQPPKQEEEIIDMRLLNSQLKFDNPNGGVWTQGWDITPTDSNKPLTIYIIPHSHCDPGWIKTFDQYFQSQTKHILTTVYNALLSDQRRTFIWAEISYFEWWWREQTYEVQQNMKRLIDNKQFEFVTGGWVQPDEANTQRYAIEVQLQEGHDWIRNTFGSQAIPQYGWSIDPFGYSPTMAYILSKYNFKAMLIQRVHYAVKKELAKKQQLEFMWRQTWDNTTHHPFDIFTHVMPFYSYDVPHTCGPDPSICCQFDFARVNNYGGCPWKKAPIQITPNNVAERSMLLLDQYRKKAELYRSNVIIAPLGDDFRYQTPQEAELQYTNYQKIIDYVNENVPNVTIQFGTLSKYFQHVQGTFQPPILKGSFFTYADRNEDYWSGYFTSRVFDKALDKKLERSLYAATMLGASKVELQSARRALSLFQHHDGVTGTAKNHVVLDYAQIIYTNINSVQHWIANHIMKQSNEHIKDQIIPCYKSDSPRGLSQNICDENEPVYAFNALETPQLCRDVNVEGLSVAIVPINCDHATLIPESNISFNANGMMSYPIHEKWNVWKVKKGGAYLFFPGEYVPYSLESQNVKILEGGLIVETPFWKRTVVEKIIPTSYNTNATVIDFIFETNLQNDNEEWVVRFEAPIYGRGVFHTDLNGFNFDTHYFRQDLPIQSQVFPMPTLASIEDDNHRMTILSEHAQGTASLNDHSIDVWLDRRLRQDDERGLGQGVRDNVPTRTKLRVLMEKGRFNIHDEFEITPLCKHMWDELNHPLEMYGSPKIATIT